MRNLTCSCFIYGVRALGCTVIWPGLLFTTHFEYNNAVSAGGTLRRRGDAGVEMTAASFSSKNTAPRGQLFAENGVQDEDAKDK